MVSVQVISELAGVLFSTFRIKDTTKYVNSILSYRMDVLPVTTEIVRSAATYSRDVNITPYDGIHVATAVLGGAEAILSADRGLDKAKLIRRVDPLMYQREG